MQRMDNTLNYSETMADQLLRAIPFFDFFSRVHGLNPVRTFKTWFYQRILGFNRAVQWAVHPRSRIVSSRNIEVGVNTNPGLNPGCYIHGSGRITFGDYIKIGANCAILSENNRHFDPRMYLPLETRIGNYSVIGMNSLILPGVILGDHTRVEPHSVVTESFPEGNCVIGGNPAKLIRRLHPTECIDFKREFEFIGYKRVK